MSAIVVPLREDRVEEWRAWIRECTGPRKEEFNEFHERMGLTTHRVWLTRSPQGPMAIVVFDGPGAEDFRQKVARSKEPFDKWFRDHVSEYHGVDSSKIAKAEPPEMVLDWYVPSYAEVSE